MERWMQKLFSSQLCLYHTEGGRKLSLLFFFLSREIVADMHTPQELAAMNDCTDILRYLDGIASKQVHTYLHLIINI